MVINILWYLLPLTAAVSLVWQATRYEDPRVIMRRSVKLFLQILAFMAAILVVLHLLSYNL